LQLPALLFGAVDDIHLLLGGEVYEINREAGHPDPLNRVVFRSFIALRKDSLDIM